MAQLLKGEMHHYLISMKATDSIPGPRKLLKNKVERKWLALVGPDLARVSVNLYIVLAVTG